jgi:tetratricopeptide (TPR) repeat protein
MGLVIGTLKDGLRLLWQLQALNWRKSWWIFRGRKGPAPCQHPSDYGRPGETECDACRLLARPGRLHAVCPLLRSTPAGWMCAVDSRNVRPFWGRSLVVFATLAAGFYLGAATATYYGLKFVGYPGLTWAQVAWPGSWPQVREAQSRNFLERAARLFKAGRANEAMLAVSSAIQSDPHNFDARLLLAQIWSLQGNFEFAAHAFDELEKEFPAQQRRIALTRHDTLVTLGQGRLLAEYALAKTRTERNQFAFWVQSLLFGLRLSQQAAAFSAAAQDEIAALPEYARRLVAMEALLQQGKNAEAKAWLERPFDGPWNAVYARQQVEMLLRLGAYREAGTLLDRYAIVLGPFQHELLHFTLSKSRGDEVTAQADLHGLLAKRPENAQVEYLCAVLVRFPDRTAVERLQALYGGNAASLPRETATAIWVAATLAQENETARSWAGILRTKGVVVPAEGTIDLASTELASPHSVPFLVNTLPLPREVVQSLALRVKRK